MNLKEELIKLKNKLLDAKKTPKDDNSSLNEKIEDFISWYEKKLYNGYICREPEVIKNFIDKMAIWYELRYPEHFLVSMLSNETAEVNNNTMFNENPYIRKTNKELDVLLDNNKSDEIFGYLEWDKFYNAKSFINSLPDVEKCLFLKPRYSWWINYDYASFFLTATGTVERVTYYRLGMPQFDYKKLVGMHITDVVPILEKEFPHDDLNRIKKEISDYNNHCKFKEELLNCVMYKIMDRGKDEITAYRAFLFAKEFNRNIDFPLQYGLGRIEFNLQKFIADYFKAGGKRDLVCYTNYYTRNNKFEKLKTITMQEIIERYPLEWHEQFMEEDFENNKNELVQRMVDSLSGTIDKEELNEEKLKQLRLERKYNKNKKGDE